MLDDLLETNRPYLPQFWRTRHEPTTSWASTSARPRPTPWWPTRPARALGFGESGPGNHEVVGYDGLGLRAAECGVGCTGHGGHARPARSRAPGFGVAGYDWPSERQPTLDAIRPLGTCRHRLRSSTTPCRPAGRCLGRLGRGRRGRHRLQLLGAGPHAPRRAGDGPRRGWARAPAPASWSGRPRARCRARGRGAAHPPGLTQAFIERCGARDADDLLEGLCFRTATAWRLMLHRSSSRWRARATRWRREAIAWAGRELGSLAVGVIRQLEFEALEFEVVLVGSLYDGGPMLIEPMRETILPGRAGGAAGATDDSAVDRRGAARDGAGRAAGARPAREAD